MNSLDSEILRKKCYSVGDTTYIIVMAVLFFWWLWTVCWLIILICSLTPLQTTDHRGKQYIMSWWTLHNHPRALSACLIFMLHFLGAQDRTLFNSSRISMSDIFKGLMMLCPVTLVMNHTFQEHSHSSPHRPLSTFDSLFDLQFDFESLPNLRILQDAPSPSAPTRDLSCRCPRVT